MRHDPINSRMNYGYTVVRSAIARKLVATVFHPTFGIHHDNQLNAFNLADDLMEPYRAIVDLVAHNNIASTEKLKLPMILRLTEKQYNNTFMLVGESDYQEEVVGVNSHIII